MEQQPQTRLVQYRHITGVHLKNPIDTQHFEEEKETFSLENKHIENIQIEAETVLVDIDNGQGIAIPIADVQYLSYELQEEEVPVQKQQRQRSEGQAPRGRQPR